MARPGRPPTTLPNREITPETIVLGLAGAVRNLGAATSIIGGSIRIEVTGSDGDSWRLDLDQPGGVCRKGDPSAASATLHASPEALVMFFSNPEAIPELVAKRELSVSGDADRLLRLAAMLGQTRSWLDRT